MKAILIQRTMITDFKEVLAMVHGKPEVVIKSSLDEGFLWILFCFSPEKYLCSAFKVSLKTVRKSVSYE